MKHNLPDDTPKWLCDAIAELDTIIALTGNNGRLADCEIYGPACLALNNLRLGAHRLAEKDVA